VGVALQIGDISPFLPQNPANLYEIGKIDGFAIEEVADGGLGDAQILREDFLAGEAITQEGGLDFWHAFVTHPQGSGHGGWEGKTPHLYYLPVSRKVDEKSMRSRISQCGTRIAAGINIEIMAENRRSHTNFFDHVNR